MLINSGSPENEIARAEDQKVIDSILSDPIRWEKVSMPLLSSVKSIDRRLI